MSKTDLIQKIQIKLKNLEKQIDKLDEEAKTNLCKSKQSKGSGKQLYKNKCLMALKKKKALENQVKKYMNQQMALQQMKINSQTMQSNKQMAQQMQQALNKQKKEMQKIDINKMDDLNDKMLEMKMQSDYMNQMMNRNYDLDVDEDEFDDEFLQFEKEVKIQNKKKELQLNQSSQSNQVNLPNVIKD